MLRWFLSQGLTKAPPPVDCSCHSCVLREAVGSYAENQRITAVRRVYQRGCVNPMINIEQLWRDYSKYEEASEPPRRHFAQASPASDCPLLKTNSPSVSITGYQRALGQKDDRGSKSRLHECQESCESKARVNGSSARGRPRGQTNPKLSVEPLLSRNMRR